MEKQPSGFTGAISGIADNALMDSYGAVKHQGVIPPLELLQRIDALLEPSQTPVLQLKAPFYEAGAVNQDEARREAAHRALSDTCPSWLLDEPACASQQQWRAVFEASWGGFAPKAPNILEKEEQPREALLRGRERTCQPVR